MSEIALRNVCKQFDSEHYGIKDFNLDIHDKEVIDAIVRNHAVYFAAVGGAGALLSKCITKSEIVCYEDLGAEAIRKIEIRDFPVIVVIDSQGDNLYETAVKEFAG